MTPSRVRRIILPLLLLAGVAYFFSRPNTGLSGGPTRRLTYSEFVQAIDNNVSAGVFDKHYFRGRLTRGDQAFTVYLPSEASQEYTLLVEKLQAHNVRYEFQEPVVSDNVLAMVISVLLPLGVIFVFWMFFLRQAQRNGYPQS